MKATVEAGLERTGWALAWLLVFSLPLEKSVVVFDIGSISRTFGLAAFAVTLALAIWTRRVRRPNAALLAAAAYVAWCVLTVVWSISRPASVARAATMAQLLGMLWVVWECCRTRRAQTWLLRAYVAGASAASLLTVARYTLGQQTYYNRYAAPGFDPNDMGVTLALAIPMCLHMAASSRGRAAWAVRVAAALIMAGLLLTGSRTALAAACVAFLYSALTWRAAGTAQRATGAALALLLILGTFRLAPQTSRQRLATLPEEAFTGTFHGRTRIWKTGLRVLESNWAQGVGIAAFPEAVKPWLGTSPIPGMPYTAHNTFLSVLVETGVPGALLFGLLLVTVALFAWMLGPSERALWFTVLAVWVAGVSTLTWEQRKPTWLIFGLISTAWATAFVPGERED
ncbi:MAG: O-antigen ligase family protein [Bryobacteraceae bacterium]